MSSKIKNITLTGFRAFSEEKKLDFETNKGVANIVVIHAPNGTGKTSTIEALEWAVTGEITRIRDIVEKSGGKNFKPKEGYILKNKNYRGLAGNVHIELSNGEHIRRKTLPKGNRNNDYNTGQLLSFIDNMDSFKNNILSQGYISKFSYEASNGNLFQSLVESQSKENSEDVVIYDKINDIKTKLDNDVQARKHEISYIRKLISDNEYELSELKNKTINNEDFFSSNDYDFFKQKFHLYQDISDKKLDNSIKYLKDLQLSLSNLSDRLLNFDISSYKNAFRSFLKANKIICLREEVNKLEATKINLQKESKSIFIEKENLDKYLQESNLKILSDDIENYVDLKYKSSSVESNLKKIKKTSNNISRKIFSISLDGFYDQIKTIESVRRDINTIFPNSDQYSEIILDEKKILDINRKEIILKNNELSKLDVNTFLRLEENQDISVEISNKRKLLDGFESKLKSLLKEKNSIISFEEKLSLIKSYVIEVTNDRELKDCPACGNSYESRESLLNAVNNLKSNAQSLLDGVIDNLIDQKNEVVNELSLLNKKVEDLLSNRRSTLKEEIALLSAQGKNIEFLFKSIRSLGIEPIEGAVIEGILSLIIEKENKLTQEISRLKERKSKYERWLSNLDYISDNNELRLQQYKSKIEEIQEYYLVNSGLDIHEIIFEANYIHVIKYKHHQYTTRLSHIENELYNVENKLSFLNEKLNRAKINFPSSNKNYKDILINSQLEVKSIRANYNYLISNIKDFKISSSENMISFIFRFNELVSVFLSNMIALQEIEKKQSVINENTEELRRVQKDLEQTTETLNKVEDSIIDTKEYFAKTASESINNDVLNDMFMYVEPHLKYDKISFKVDIKKKNKGIYIQTGSSSSKEKNTPVYYLSEAQINILSICIFLAQHAKNSESSINSIVIDDPVQSMDDLNSYALIDLCKIFARRFNKQIIITTHNRSFFNLFKSKLPEERYSTKYISM